MKSKKFFQFVVSIVILLILMKLSLVTNVFESLEELFGSFSFSYDLLFRLLITVLIIYIICSLFNMIIEIIPVHNNRIRTMLTIFRSFANYAAVIFAICFDHRGIFRDCCPGYRFWRRISNRGCNYRLIYDCLK